MPKSHVDILDSEVASPIDPTDNDSQVSVSRGMVAGCGEGFNTHITVRGEDFSPFSATIVLSPANYKWLKAYFAKEKS